MELAEGRSVQKSCSREQSHSSKTLKVRGKRAALQRRVSLCETLDRVLNKGAVVAGDIVISVADVDLVYISLQLVVTSVENMKNMKSNIPSNYPRELAPSSRYGANNGTLVSAKDRFQLGSQGHALR